MDSIMDPELRASVLLHKKGSFKCHRPGPPQEGKETEVHVTSQCNGSQMKEAGTERSSPDPSPSDLPSHELWQCVCISVECYKQGSWVFFIKKKSPIFGLYRCIYSGVSF